MTRPRHEVLARIRACLKYADPSLNSNEHERTAAKRAAEKLVEEYGITANELGTINSELFSVMPSESENLSSVLSTLKAAGFEPSRGWGSLDPQKVNKFADNFRKLQEDGDA